MQIVCPECEKDHPIDDEKLPSHKFNAICRGCKARFVVEVVTCPDCGAKNQLGYPCFCTLEIEPEELEVVETDEGATEAVSAPAGGGLQEERLAEAGEKVEDGHEQRDSGHDVVGFATVDDVAGLIQDQA